MLPFVDVVRFGADPTGHKDASGAFNDALRRAAQLNLPVFVPPGTYAIHEPITMPDWARLSGTGAKSVLISRLSSRSMQQGVIVAGEACVVSDLTIDGGNRAAPRPPFETYCVLAPRSNVTIMNVWFANWRRRAVYGLAASGLRVIDCDFTAGGAATSITLTDCTDAFVRGCDLSGNPSNFGIYLDGECRRVLIENNRANNAAQLAAGTRSLEPIGVTRLCSHIQIIGNHCEGSGDNGISVTGSFCTVANNVVLGNYHHGICVYGSNNTVAGNIVGRNSRRFLVDGTQFHNITIQPAFGGRAHNNVVSGNICFDEPPATAGYGVRVSASAYPAWRPNHTLPSGNPYCFVGRSVYRAVAGGTTGDTPPSHTEGDAPDGTVVWRHLFTDPHGLHPRGNVVVGNSLTGHRLDNSVSEQVVSGNTISLNGGAA